MKKQAKLWLLSGLCLLWLSTAAQRTWPFLVSSNTPVYFNPAFAGSLENGRLALTLSRESVNQSLLNQSVSMGAFSWDQQSHRLRGGIGVIADFSHHNIYQRGRLGFMWSPKFKIGPNLTLAPGIGVDAGLIFAERYKFTYGGGADPIFLEGDTTVLYPEVNVGVLLNTRNFYLGLSLNSLNKPRPRIFPDVDYPGPFERHLSLQVGYTFKPQSNPNWSASIQGMGLLGEQTMFQSMVNVKYKRLIGGIGYQRRSFLSGFPITFDMTHLLLNLAYKTRRFKVSYTQGIDLIVNNGAGVVLQEISLLWYL